MDIACCTDHKYLKYCITMLLSFFDHHREEDVCVHLLANSLRPEEEQKVRDVVEKFCARIEVYPVDGDFLSSLTQGQYSYITPTTYARLFLSEVLPTDVEKVIYLDCDLIVLDSLVPLWTCSLEKEYELAVVEDSCSANPCYYERLHISNCHRYFNAGVLLIDLSAWRERKFVELALDLLNTSKLQLDYADQDVLNVLCEGRVKYLPFRFNLQEAMLRRYVPEIGDDARRKIVESLSSPAVIHFTYLLKPWSYTSFHPYREHFYYYFDQTEWCGERPVPTWKERMQRFMWWGASMVKMVNIYHPLPAQMKMDRWMCTRQPLHK